MHPEVLNEKTKEVWSALGFLEDFYLAGGTALALQIGHRVSVDLDFFSGDPIKKNLINKLEDKFGPLQILVNSKNELTVIIKEVKVTFLHYPFSLVVTAVKTNIVSIASVRDIASMKAYSL